jgi:hypothetical protein
MYIYLGISIHARINIYVIGRKMLKLNEKNLQNIQKNSENQGKFSISLLENNERYYNMYAYIDK